MKDSNISVSICCAVYNHKSFITQTLNSFLNQKTNFLFEVLVNDDASTDGTIEILKEFELKYPKIIKVVYQSQNQYSMGKKIVMDLLLPRVKGKYIALCEGDDYWTDENKLQCQYDAMEKNKQCVFSVHKVQDISVDNKLIENYYPNILISQSIINTKDFFEMSLDPYIYIFHASSFFFRKEAIIELTSSIPSFIKKSGVGDVPLTWFLACKGNIYYIDKTMSFYRRDTAGSWSMRMQNRDYRKKMIEKNLILFKEFNNYTDFKYNYLLKNDILKLEFDFFRLNNQFFKLKNKKYRKYYEQLSIKDKIKYFLLNVFPVLERINR